MRKLYSFIFYFLPALAFAQDGCNGVICNPLSNFTTSDGDPVSTITDVLDYALQVMIMIALPITGALIVYTGYTFASAKGDPAKIKKARDTLTYIVIGLAILLASKGIQMALQATIESLQ
jgi:hypothetical protein